MYKQPYETLRFPFSGIITSGKRRPVYQGFPDNHFYLPRSNYPDTVGAAVDEQFLQRLITIVEMHFENEAFGVGQLAAESGLCRRQLHRKLRALLNQSPSGFIRTRRLQRAVELIRHSRDTFAEIAYKSGFNTPNYFCKVFRQAFGCTPKEYRIKWVKKVGQSTI